MNIYIRTLVCTGRVFYHGHVDRLKEVLDKNGILYRVEMVDEKDFGGDLLVPIYCFKKL